MIEEHDQVFTVTSVEYSITPILAFLSPLSIPFSRRKSTNFATNAKPGQKKICKMKEDFYACLWEKMKAHSARFPHLSYRIEFDTEYSGASLERIHLKGMPANDANNICGNGEFVNNNIITR